MMMLISQSSTDLSKFKFSHVVTIDGPAGSGKSHLGMALAEQFGAFYLDSGKLYRAIASAAIGADINCDESERVSEFVNHIKIEFRLGERISDIAVYVNNINLTDTLNEPNVSMLASTVSKYPAVRQAILDYQRELGKSGCIAVGRDMGSVVFPYADLKIYLTASPEVRALRRFLQEHQSDLVSLNQSNIEGSDEFKSVLELIKKRDLQDRTRAVSPLRIPDGAFVLDNSNMSFDQTISEAAHRIEHIEVKYS